MKQTLRQLLPGDVVHYEGAEHTVASSERAAPDAHGYPLWSVTFTDGGHILHNATHTVELLEGSSG